jgi:hypothetical protein
MKLALTFTLLAMAAAGDPASARAIDPGDRSIIEIVPQLKTGDFVWAPERSPTGSALLVINVETQRAVLFRNGVPIGATTVSTGRKGYETPTGVFTILEKKKEHYSKTYDNAPMPNMQRLTWRGIALHAGKLPGYPASHGCIRLPVEFSSHLFGMTDLGMTVVITSIPASPAIAEAPPVASEGYLRPDMPLSSAPFEWHPESSPATTYSIVSVVISAADGKAIVLRNGAEIGSAPVRVTGETKPMAYVLRAWDSTGQHWLKLQFGGTGEGMEVTPDEGKRFEAPVMFRHAVATVLRPGSVVIVTPEALRAGSPGRSQTVIEDEPAPAK